VNNAGITIDKTVAAMTEDDWYNVLAAPGRLFLSCRQRWISWIRNRRIVNVSVVGDRQYRPATMRHPNQDCSPPRRQRKPRTCSPSRASAATTCIGITVNTGTGLIATEMIASNSDGVTENSPARSPRRALPREGSRGYSLPVGGRLLLHHGTSVDRQRWHGHVTANSRSAWDSRKCATAELGNPRPHCRGQESRRASKPAPWPR
jgi:hypothetical protein